MADDDARGAADTLATLLGATNEVPVTVSVDEASPQKVAEPASPPATESDATKDVVAKEAAHFLPPGLGVWVANS